MSFNDVLETVAKMPLDDQEMLIDILNRRRIARWRTQLAKDIASARRQFRAGKCKVATPEEIMREILS